MTPQEQQLVADLFDRLASLEGQRRDADAERLIREGLGRAPNAIYALVQSVLVQDEALKRANARIEELERTAGDSQPAPGTQGGFLDNMRNALMGERSHGSVPSVPPVRPAGQGTSGVWGARPEPVAPAAYAAPMAGPMGAGSMPGSGSFLGTAAATVAGVIGGGLMLDGIRSMMGGHHGAMGDYQHMQPDHAASPWDAGGGGGGGSLDRDAGLGDIGGHRTAAYDDSRGSGLFSSGADDQPDDDGGNDDGGNDDGGNDNGGDFGGGDTDSA